MPFVAIWKRSLRIRKGKIKKPQQQTCTQDYVRNFSWRSAYRKACRNAHMRERQDGMRQPKTSQMGNAERKQSRQKKPRNVGRRRNDKSRRSQRRKGEKDQENVDERRFTKENRIRNWRQSWNGPGCHRGQNLEACRMVRIGGKNDGTTRSEKGVNF